MRRLLSRVSLGLIAIYVIPLTGYVLVRRVPADVPWWLDLADTFTLFLFIPTAAALLLGLLSLSRLSLLLCAIPIVLFALLYGGLFVPRSFYSTATGAAFSVMIHNVDAAVRHPERVAQIIIEADPDVVAVQELTTDTAEALVARLSDRYPYRALVPRTDYSGVGTFSRFPIEADESFVAGHLAQHLVLDLHGQSVHLFNVHPGAPRVRWTGRQRFPPYIIRSFDTEQQTRQLSAILRKVNEADGPVLLVGDFNLTDQTRQYRQITQELTDAYREIGWGFGHTFPTAGRLPRLLLPLLRIDYIFHSREFAALEARVGASTGSDHLPVVARLSFRN